MLTSASLRKVTNSFMQTSRSAGTAKLPSSGPAEELFPLKFTASPAIVNQRKIRCSIAGLDRREGWSAAKRGHFLGIADDLVQAGKRKNIYSR
jgi:hypothetical protein